MICARRTNVGRLEERRGLARMIGCAEMGDMFSRFCSAVIGFVLKFILLEMKSCAMDCFDRIGGFQVQLDY